MNSAKNPKSLELLDDILGKLFDKNHNSTFSSIEADQPFDKVNSKKIFFKNDGDNRVSDTIKYLLYACQEEPPTGDEYEKKRLDEIISIFEDKHKWIWEKEKNKISFYVFDKCPKKHLPPSPSSEKESKVFKTYECWKMDNKECNKYCPRKVISKLLIDYELKINDIKEVEEIYDKIQQCKEFFSNKPLETKIENVWPPDAWKTYEYEIEPYCEIEANIKKCLDMADLEYENLAYIKWYIAHLKIWMGIKKREERFLKNDENDKKQIYELLCSSSNIIKKLTQKNEKTTEIDEIFVHTESDRLMAYLICKDSGISIEESDKPDIDYIENRAKNLKNNRLKAEIYLSLWYYSKEEKSNEDTEKYRKNFRAICQEKNDTLELEMLNLEYLVYQYIDICKGADQSQEVRKEVDEKIIKNLLEKLKMDVAKSKHKDTFWAISYLYDLYYSGKWREYPAITDKFKVDLKVVITRGESVVRESVVRESVPAKEKSEHPCMMKCFEFMGCPDEYRRIMGIKSFFTIVYRELQIMIS